MLKNKGRDPIDFSFYVKQHTLGFTGRTWVFDAINDWLAQPDGSRFFILTGAPGSGKTAIASRLFQFSWEKVLPPDGLAHLCPGFLHAAHFCSSRDSRWISPHTFAESLAIQLAESFDAYAQALVAKREDRQIVIKVNQRVRRAKGSQIVGVLIEKLDVSAVSPESAFERVVREPLEALFHHGFDQQVVILVDALEESLLSSQKPNIFSLLSHAQYLPAGVRFIVTTRPEPEVLPSLRRLPVEEHALTSGEGLIKSEGDVRQYVVNTMISTYPTVAAKLAPGLSSTNFADILQAKGKGNFLYIQYLLKMLVDQEGDITGELLDSQPEELEGIYLEFLERLVGNEQKSWEERYAPIVGTLTVAQEALSEKQLAGIVNATESKVRSSLKALRQLLEVNDALPASKRTFTLYHRSFADYLLNSDRAEHYWCQAEEQHRRIADYYRSGARSWNEVDWGLVDEYGLRHLSFHIVKGYTDGLKQISEMMNAAFISTKSARFNTERSVLDDVRLAIRAAREAGDLPLLLRWTWLYAGWRDRIAQAMVPELLHLYVRIGQADRALDMIKALDPTRMTWMGEERKVPEYMAYALAEQGLVDKALTVARSISNEPVRDKVLSGVAQRVAHQDRTRAIQIVRDVHISSVNPELCQILAEDEAYLKDALEIAHNSGPALETIALQVAHRDIDRALAIIDTIQPYDEDSGGDRWRRTNDVARGNLAHQIASTNPDQALTLLEQIQDTQEIHLALVRVAGELASIDVKRALALVDSPGMPELVRGLALAYIAMKTNDPAMQEEVRQQWEEVKQRWNAYLAENFSGVRREDIDLIARLDLIPLRSHPLALKIVSYALTVLEDSVRKWASWPGELIPVRHVYEALGVLGAALAIFDLDRALGFLEWAFQHESLQHSGVTGKDEAFLMMVDMVARFDPRGARRVIDRIVGALHQAYVITVKRVSEYSYEQALAIVDGIDPKFSLTKAILLGTLGNSLAPDQKEKAQELLSRAPRFIQSDIFCSPLREAVKVLAGEIARVDIDKGIALAEGYRSLWSKEDALKAIHLIDVARCAAECDLERAIKLASQITDGFGLAQVMLAIARNSLIRDEALSALQKASTTLIHENRYTVREDHIDLLVDIAIEMALLAPWDALDLEIDMRLGSVKQQRALKAIMQAILDQESLSLESTSLPLRALQHLGERLYHVPPFLRYEFFRVLLGLLDPALSLSVLDWLETRDASLSLQLRGWYLAESDPDAALAVFASIGEESFALKKVIVRSAAHFPDRALELYHQGNEELRVLLEALGAIAKRDSTRALAITATEPWKDQFDRWKALATIASVVAKSDWQQALHIIQPISDDSLRSSALSRIVAVLPQNLPHDDVDLAVTRLTTEAGALPYPNDRLHVYESLIGFLQARPLLSLSTTAALIEAIGMGDSGVFLQLLPDLIRLVCKGDRRMPFRLEDEPGYIETLLDA